MLNRLFRCRSKKTSKVTGEFPAQMASNAENVSIWWCHRGVSLFSFRSSIPRKSTEREDLQRNSNRKVCINVLQILLVNNVCVHYSDVIMSAMASHITGVSIVRSNVCSGAEQRKRYWHLRGNSPVTLDSPHKWLATRKMLPFGDLIICASIKRHSSDWGLFSRQKLVKPALSWEYIIFGMMTCLEI